MIELGYFSLCLALGAAAYTAVVAFIGGQRQYLPLIRSGENAALVACGLMTLSLATLWYALLTHDFQVQYVSETTNRAMPFVYLISALWGGQSGSLLFWGWQLSVFGALVVLFNRHRFRRLMPYVVSTMAATTFYFIVLNLFAADPFKRLPFTPVDGNGLNPLLQHPYMAIHPPMLYAGMVGMSVPFAFGLAALISGQLDLTWLRAARRWVLIPWTFLGAGLLLGGKWAYVELGWGGYWAWDAVENSSFMPWLAATAFIHSIMVQERKGMLKVWNFFLVFLTYGLCIFGTFLTRSGMVESVHAFARSNVGPFFAVFLILIATTTTLLLLFRFKNLGAESRLESVTSRETAFLLNNWIFLGLLFAVFWGTLFPVISEAFSGEKITVSAPFFNTVSIPIALILMFLTGAGPLFAWRHTSKESLRRSFTLPLACILATALLTLLIGIRDVYAIMSFSLCAFVVASIATEFHRGARARQRSVGDSYARALYGLLNKNRRRYGGYVVHLAMVLLFIGFTGKAFTIEKEFVLGYGESIQIKNYRLTYNSLAQKQDANMSATAGVLGLERDEVFLATLLPQRRFYPSADQSTTEVSIFSSWQEDFYLVLIGSADDMSTKFQVYINPLIRWVWSGGILFVIGSLWSMWPTARDRRLAAMERDAIQEWAVAPVDNPRHPSLRV
jgi:cytochrome c-type biogenesis protein CcmF